MKATATIEFDVPEGYEATGEIRCPKQDEYYLYRFHYNRVGEVNKASFDFQEEKYPILRKAEVWKTLTEAKVLEHMKSQKPITLRHKLGRANERETTVITELKANSYGTLYFHVFTSSHVDLLEYLEESK